MSDDDFKRTRVRCPCGWQGQRRLPADCPCCSAKLQPTHGKPGRPPGTGKGRRVRQQTWLPEAVVAWLEARGRVSSEIARIVEAEHARSGTL